ncbi:hypothetical protein GCM10027586_07890 [Kineococcus gypseus]|uniref:hypothetical protein n=1 Tax=Kineococcus gypseus TaxID=1637102 RepID=UPI003D7E34C6
MTRGFIPERDGAGNEDHGVMRVDLDFEVPGEVLEQAPARRGGMPRRFAKYPGLQGRDVVDFLQGLGVVLGEHDRAVADRLADELDFPTLLTVLSWVRRAGAGAGAEAPRS